MIEKTCVICNKEFKVKPYRKDIAKFCSQKCFGESLKDKPSWNKGIKCPQPSGENNGNWKGGKRMVGDYLYILTPDHPCADKKGYVKHSHLVMEKKIGRFLKPPECIHHINSDKLDDRIENLMLFKNNSEHMKFHYPKGTPFPVKK